MQKLPKLLETDSDIKSFVVTLNQTYQSSPLWREGQRVVPLIEFSEDLRKALAFARRCGTLQGGLESIESFLQAEEKGLTGTRRAEGESKISRLLLISNDGSERFYRHCESLLFRYTSRLMCLKINASSLILGQNFFGKEKAVKAMLVDRKDVMLKVLSSLVGNGKGEE